jgi:ribosome maturation factor RimP
MIRGDSSPLFLFTGNLESKEEKRIKAIVEEAIVENQSIFLVEVIVKGISGNQKVIVLLDGDEGISIDECSRVSRTLGNLMEEEELMEGKYTLEVSSPGLDHPLKLHRQYVKNKGRSLEVETTEGEKIEGKLTEVTDQGIVMNVKKEDRTMSFTEISQSKVVVSFK